MVTKQKSPDKGGFRMHLGFICQLWQDDKGKVSHSKFWNNIACAAATVTFVKMGVDIKIDFFQWYLGLVGFQALASKFMAMKLGAPPTNTTPTTSK